MVEFSPQHSSFPSGSLEWLKLRVAARWYPRDLTMAAGFLADELSGRGFFLYGAGSHTMALLELWQDSPILKQLRGIVDSRPQDGQRIAGFPVYPAAETLNFPDVQIALSHTEFEEGMEQNLLSIGVEPDRIISVYRNSVYGEPAVAAASAQLETTLQQLPPRDGKKRIAVVNARQRSILGERELGILATGHQYQLFQINMERFSLKQTGWAEASFDAQNSLALLFYIIARLQPDLVYVQEHYSSGNFLPAVLALQFPERKVVGEFYDFLGLTFDDPQILTKESYWSSDDVDLAMVSERWSIEHLTGIVTKESGSALAAYLSGSCFLEVQPHLSRERFVRKKIGCHHPPRLVWAGTIAASHQSPVLYGNNQLLDVFTDLVDLGCEVTAYTSCKTMLELQSHYGDYLQLAEREKFNIHAAIPQQQLLEKMAADFDFGLMLGRMAPDSQQGVSNRVTVSAKLFSYLAAGLPVIASEFYEAMGTWIRDNGLGILVDPDRLETLPRLLAECRYDKLLANVEAFRRQNNLESNLPELIDFFARMVA